MSGLEETKMHFASSILICNDIYFVTSFLFLYFVLLVTLDGAFTFCHKVASV